MMSVANTTGMPSRDSSTAIFWMRLMSAAENSKADIWKPMPLRASSSADRLGRPAESGPVIVPLLSSMSWLIFSLVVMRARSAASRGSAPGTTSATALTQNSIASSRQGRRDRNADMSGLQDGLLGRASVRCTRHPRARWRRTVGNCLQRGDTANVQLRVRCALPIVQAFTMRRHREEQVMRLIGFVLCALLAAPAFAQDQTLRDSVPSIDAVRNRLHLTPQQEEKLRPMFRQREQQLYETRSKLETAGSSTGKREVLRAAKADAQSFNTEVESV